MHQPSRMHQQISSMHQPSHMHQQHGTGSIIYSDSSATSSGATSSGPIDEQSGDNDSHCVGQSASRAFVPMYADSFRLEAHSHGHNHPLTFDHLHGGDDDTPTAQFVPAAPPVSVTQQQAQQSGQRRKKNSSQSSLPSHLDPHREAFWRPESPTGPSDIQQQLQPWQMDVQAPQLGASGLPAINKIPGMHVLPSTEGDDLVPSANMPGVLCAVEVQIFTYCASFYRVCSVLEQ